MWTCSRCFLYCLRPGLFATEGADAKNACIGSANSACTRGVYAKVSYAGGAGGVSAIKSLGIHLQSSRILELR